MVLIAALALTAHLGQRPASVETWEKRLGPGLVFRMEWDPTIPRTIYALRLNLKGQACRPIAQLAGHTVFEENPSKGRTTVTEMVRDDHAVAGINGDFFPFTGDPLNLMVRDGELVSAPYVGKGTPEARRATFGWGPGFATPGFATMTSTLEAGTDNFPLAGWDEECEPGQMTLNTPAVGSVKAKAPNVYAVIRTTGTWGPTSEVKGEVTEVGTDVILRPVQPGTAIVVAAGSVKDKLLALREGEAVTIKTKVEGFDWSKVTNVIGGGPVLVRDGQVFIDAAEERFRDTAGTRQPRSAIGRTAKDEIWFVAVDGRTKISGGATFEELAGIMKGLGCVDAINLDGGGSTTFNLLGLTFNRPSDGVERPVANGVLVLGTRPPATAEELVLPSFSHALSAKDKLTLHVGYAGDAHRSVRNVEVLWNATGSAWIDQGGTLHLVSEGTVEVTALVHGQVLKARYETTGPPAEKAPGFSADN